MSDLPENARRYVDAVERLSGAPICLVSVGPERHQTIERRARPLRPRPPETAPSVAPAAAPAVARSTAPAER